ncbi:hypothetical protein GCM10027592_56520 [Spirosoma flavus]
MQTKPTKSDNPKRGMAEASEMEQTYFESHPDGKRVTLQEVLERSKAKANVLVK